MSDTKLLVVTKDIPFGDRGAYAYRVGDKVSAKAVKANDWGDYVATESSQAAKNAVAEATGSTAKEA
jgi:hypothetical protein